MNRPVPHIGQTMQQKRALAHYVPMAEEARRERERADQINASLQVDALMDRMREAGTGECAHDDPTLPTWRDVLGVAVIDIALALAVIVVWGIFGLILSDPMRAALTVLGVFQ